MLRHLRKRQADWGCFITEDLPWKTKVKPNSESLPVNNSANHRQPTRRWLCCLGCSAWVIHTSAIGKMALLWGHPRKPEILNGDVPKSILLAELIVQRWWDFRRASGWGLDSLSGQVSEFLGHRWPDPCILLGREACHCTWWGKGEPWQGALSFAGSTWATLNSNTENLSLRNEAFYFLTTGPCQRHSCCTF